jgi:hypothetical protein
LTAIAPRMGKAPKAILLSRPAVVCHRRATDATKTAISAIKLHGKPNSAVADCAPAGLSIKTGKRGEGHDHCAEE